MRYGQAGRSVRFPSADVRELRMNPRRPLPDPAASVEAALSAPIGSPPLSELTHGRRDACVVISDITRPVPNRTILPPILRAVEEAGVPRERILILIATGIHRPNEGAELIELVGEEIAGAYRVGEPRRAGTWRAIGRLGRRWAGRRFRLTSVFARRI